MTRCSIGYFTRRNSSDQAKVGKMWRITSPFLKRTESKPISKMKNLSVEYRRYIVSLRWFEKRNEAMRHYGRKCHTCGATKRLEVHHLTYERLGEELMSDLMVLCFGCHKAEHSGYKVNSTPVLKEFVSKTLNKKANKRAWFQRELKRRRGQMMRNYFGI